MILTVINKSLIDTAVEYSRAFFSDRVTSRSTSTSGLFQLLCSTSASVLFWPLCSTSALPSRAPSCSFFPSSPSPSPTSLPFHSPPLLVAKTRSYLVVTAAATMTCLPSSGGGAGDELHCVRVEGSCTSAYRSFWVRNQAMSMWISPSSISANTISGSPLPGRDHQPW
jgi:hypothetical protein